MAGVVFAGAPVQAGDESIAVRIVHPQHQVFNDNLVVASGENYDGDVVVYNGDVKVEDGGRIAGNLIVYSGDITIEQGGYVGGDLTAVSGDVQIDGRVEGSVAVLSGDAELGDESSVGGDVSVVSGDVERARGAYVGGSTLRGPQLNIQIPPIIAPGAVPGVDVRPPMPPFSATRPVSLGERLLGFFGRVVAAGAALILIVGGAVVVATVRPQLAADVRATLRRQPALSFAVGLFVNMIGVAVIGFMFVTICLAPPAALLGLALLVANVIGLSGAGAAVADRLPINLGSGNTGRTAVGVALPGAIVAFLWLLGGCFAFFGYMLAMILASFGLGAFLVKVLKLGEPAPGAAAAPPTSSSAPVPEPPVATPPAAEPAAPAGTAPVAADAPAAVTPVAPVEPAAASVAPPASAQPDDFRRIAGIGAVFQQRLYDAGITTYAALADRSPEELAEILRWPVERVARDRLIEQAAELTERQQWHADDADRADVRG
jgi:predicted flap endonuclease-1-like 5' DNA nuclease/cytoskeletal protein CcmA (bactofilin family)